MELVSPPLADGAIAGAAADAGAGTGAAAGEPEVLRQLAAQRAALARFLMGWSLVMDFLWWLTDPFLLRDIPGALGALVVIRLWVLGGGALTLCLLTRAPELSGPRLWACVAIWVVEVGGVASGMARMGGLETPWFHLSYPLVIATFIFPMPPLSRLVFSGAMATGLVTGFLLARPEELRSPFLPSTLGYMVFTIGVAIAFGQRFYALSRRSIEQQLALAGHGDELQREVQARTSELRRLAAHIDRVSEEERSRIALELHDELGQSVSALRLSLATTLRRFRRDAGSIGANLEDLDELARRVADGAKDAIAHLRPRILDDRGLAAAAEWLARSTERRAGLRCALRIEGPPPPAAAPGGDEDAPRREASEAELAAFRILQEALTNVVRHASARSAEVALRLGADAIELAVEDDGVGLPPGGARGQGLGLIGMRERARSLGGELSLSARPGGGTRLRCRLPLARRAAKI